MNRLILLIALLSVNITSAFRVDWVVPCSFQHKLIQNNNENISRTFIYPNILFFNISTYEIPKHNINYIQII